MGPQTCQFLKGKESTPDSVLTNRSLYKSTNFRGKEDILTLQLDIQLALTVSSAETIFFKIQETGEKLEKS